MRAALVAAGQALVDAVAVGLVGDDKDSCVGRCRGGNEKGCANQDVPAASNYGPIVDIWAPAHNLQSAHIKCSTCRRTVVYTKSGTSFAAAIVSGVVARMLQANPSLKPSEVWSRLQTDATIVTPTIDPSTGNSMLVYRAGSAVCSPELP